MVAIILKFRYFQIGNNKNQNENIPFRLCPLGSSVEDQAEVEDCQGEERHIFVVNGGKCKNSGSYYKITA